MHIKSITLNNFRCFKHLSLTLHKRLNVFFGENGTGKSSIFEAINILLGNITTILGKNEAVKSVISYQDITNAAKNSLIELTLYDEQEITWSLSAEKTIINGELNTTNSPNFSQLENYIRNIIDLIVSREKKLTLPIFLSYKSIRDTECIYATNQEPYILSVKSCYDNAISMNANCGDFFQWFKTREDLELQRNKQDATYTDKELEAVRNAITFFVDFLNFSFDRETWQFVLKKDKEQLFYNQLSDGERSYILLVGDIARRLAIANPGRDNPLEGNGVILIDEIELHLHPKWQRLIIPRLLKTFPNCQFIVTSHSPQVLGEVFPDSVWILEAGEEPYHPARSYGMESSELLREVMGAESKNAEVAQKLEAIDRLIDNGKFNEARSAIQKLAKTTGKIPAIIGTNSYLTMMGQEQAEIEE